MPRKPSSPTDHLRAICQKLPYVGSKGWIGMRRDRWPDWAEVEKIVSRS